MLEADSLLASQFDIIQCNVNPEEIHVSESIDHRGAIRVGHLFNRTTTLLWDCLLVCGLEKYIVI